MINVNEKEFIDFVITCSVVFGVMLVIVVAATWFYRIWKDDDIDELVSGLYVEDLTMLDEQSRNFVKMRILAKRLKERIPSGMSIKLPDDIANEIPDSPVFMIIFEENCESMGLQQIKGYWERK